MNKRSFTYIILKTALIIICLPVTILLLSAVALYIPAIQQYTVDKVCKSLSEHSGYTIEAKRFHLTFPLKINIDDINVRKENGLNAQGSNICVNISLLPLLRGEVEVNYLLLEQIDFNTGELIPDIKLEGNIGFLRGVARNIDIKNKRVNLRQIHLQDSDVEIELNDTAKKEEETHTDWLVKLHKGTIDNCNANIKIPTDTLATSVGIGKLRLIDGTVDLSQELYSIDRLEISSTSATYNNGNNTQTAEPLKHISVNNINAKTSNILYSSQSSNINIESLLFTQPDGVEITEFKAMAVGDSSNIVLKELVMNSRNGSHITATGNIPFSAIKPESREEFNTTLSLILDRRDLAGILTKNDYEKLNILGNKRLTAGISAKGNVRKIECENIYLEVPSLGLLKADGFIGNIKTPKEIVAEMNIKELSGDICKILHKNTTESCMLIANGNLQYAFNEANANITIKAPEGAIRTNATYNTNNNAYKAHIDINSLNLSTILPEIPLTYANMSMQAEGKGLDLFSDTTSYNINASLDSIVYDKYTMYDISMNIKQANSISDIDITGDNKELLFAIKSQTELHIKDIRNKTSIEIHEANLQKIGVTEADCGTALKLDIQASTDLKESHTLKFSGNDIKIRTPQKVFTPEDINFDFSTTPEETSLMAKNGDLNIAGTMQCGYNKLFESLKETGKMFADARHSDKTLYYLQDYEKELPSINIDFNCEQNNMLYNFMTMKGMSADNISFTLKFDTIKGINMNCRVLEFKKEDIKLDTINIFTRQNNDRIRYMASVRSSAINPKKEKQTYNAAIYGNIFNDSLTTNFIFRDRKEGVRMRLGTKTILSPENLEIHFNNNAILFGNRFNFSKGNYFNIGKGLSLNADVTLSSGDNAGIHFFTTPDEEAKYNANLELFNLSLKDITEILPYSPDITGILNLDLYFRQDDKKIILSSEARMDSITYEGSYIGNEIIEAVYFPKDDKRHYLDVRLNHDNEDVLLLSGDYIKSEEDKKGELDGKISLSRFPLELTKVFMKNSGMKLDGYINSELRANGPLSELSTNGHIEFEKVYLDAPFLGTELHFSETPVRIEDNRILFNDFNIYAKGENPFKIEGTIDINELSNPEFRLRMNANDYEIVNATRQKGSMLYGKMFVNLRAIVGGRLNNLMLGGSATLLGKSNITYVLQETPISTDKELDGLVEFVNFQDTVTTNKTKENIDFGNIRINLGLKIEEGARINADFDENRNSYLALRGGGDLNMTYNRETGVNVTGSYTMNEGELKYELPVIPLKTFNIENGSKVTWNGDILNPTLNIVALERVTTSVTFDDNSIQPVTFDVGVKLSNTLSNMGLSFTISAPENAIIQDQLNSLDEETLNKYAITMLITGTYIGGANGMTVSNALSSFLDAKINELAGSAMKSVSVNIGINDAQNAETGESYKNYSFSFRKRFWNDRITVVIGGEVNSGNVPVENESFINNVSLEWKISNSGNRYLRVFYDKNFESLLEGEIIETGIGYVYKRKLNNLGELFIFNKKEKDKDTTPNKE